MAVQVRFTLKPRRRGFHLITDEVLRQLPQWPVTGLLNLFVQHTSCALSICEKWDPSVREDLDSIYDKLIPENAPYYQHTLEGSDDMPAHAKCIITGVSINIPITDGRLNLGTWQGIYLGEFRNDGGSRQIVATILE